MGDAEGLRATAKAAEAAGKMNVAMTSYFLLQDLDAVLKLLPQQASRIPALAKLAKFAGFAKLLQNCCKIVTKMLQTLFLWSCPSPEVRSEVPSRGFKNDF